MRIYIWGTGQVASRYLKTGEISENDIVGFIESSRDKETFWGKKVYDPYEVALDNDYDYILVCVYNYGKDIYDICQKVCIDINKLIFADNWIWLDGSCMNKMMQVCCKQIHSSNIDVKRIFPKLYEGYIRERDIQAGRYIVTLRNGYDLREESSVMLSNEFSGKEYQIDYFRYRTFELVANEIIKNNVQGSVAEVGVFQGTFSKLINKKFYNKKLYLFDTFDSFDEQEYKDELQSGRCPEGFIEGFKNTSVEKVISVMPYPEKCVIKKGLFPDTAIGMENEKFAFVSIDVDFEKSILEGLRFFYPQLEQGGSIFVHDYNNRFLEGVKNAVSIYENEIGHLLCKVPLADEGGTLVIVKNA